MAPQVLIVGAGVTGSMLALLAKDMGLTVRVLEKSMGAGGRMATHSFRRGDRSTPLLAQADLGAQYISTRSLEHPFLGPLYRRLTEAGVLVPFVGEVAGPNPYGSAEVKHFAAPKGMRSIAEYLLQQSAVPVEWGAAVEDLAPASGGITVHTSKAAEEAEVVVLTQPVPQVLGESKFGMRGSFLKHTSQEVLEAMRKVQYSARYAVAYYFDKSKVSWPFSWTCQYFDRGDVRYVAHDSGRRSVDEPFMSVMVHSGVPFGMKLIDEEDPFPTASARLLSELQEKLPELPWAAAEASKVHKWKYSQVYIGYGGAKPSPSWAWSDEAGAPGYVELFQEGGLGLLCGDAIAPAGNFEGCVYSAFKAAERLRSHFNKCAA